MNLGPMLVQAGTLPITQRPVGASRPDTWEVTHRWGIRWQLVHLLTQRLAPLPDLLVNLAHARLPQCHHAGPNPARMIACTGALLRGGSAGAPAQQAAVDLLH